VQKGRRVPRTRSLWLATLDDASVRKALSVYVEAVELASVQNSESRAHSPFTGGDNMSFDETGCRDHASLGRGMHYSHTLCTWVLVQSYGRVLKLFYCREYCSKQPSCMVVMGEDAYRER
jgi:hypothetical protein